MGVFYGGPPGISCKSFEGRLALLGTVWGLLVVATELGTYVLVSILPARVLGASESVPYKPGEPRSVCDLHPKLNTHIPELHGEAAEVPIGPSESKTDVHVYRKI